MKKWGKGIFLFFIFSFRPVSYSVFISVTLNSYLIFSQNFLKTSDMQPIIKERRKPEAKVLFLGLIINIIGFSSSNSCKTNCQRIDFDELVWHGFSKNLILRSRDLNTE